MSADEGTPCAAHAARPGEGASREAAEDVDQDVVGEAAAVAGVHRDVSTTDAPRSIDLSLPFLQGQLSRHGMNRPSNFTPSFVKYCRPMRARQAEARVRPVFDRACSQRQR
jgi:hypothetical protein